MLINKFEDFKEFTQNKNLVIFVYPKLGKSGSFLPDDLKDAPAMTGCSMQAKGYEDNINKFKSLGYEVLGLSAQELESQEDFKSGLGVSFMFIADPNFILKDELNLHAFKTTDGKKFYRRQTLIMQNLKPVLHYIVDDSQNDASIALQKIKELG